MHEQQAIVDLEGQILKLRYRLGRCLSQGALGAVYQAHDLVQDRPCSLKLVRHGLSEALHPQQRLAHEAVIIARLSHRNIINGYELSLDEQGGVFLAMEPLDGVDLHHLLAAAAALPLTLVLEILGAVGAALQYAHDLGIVHRDINPSSIFVGHAYSNSSRGAFDAIKLMGFGSAKQLAPTSSGRDYGRQCPGCDSPTYTAPESLGSSDDEVDPRSDQWSLAVLAYQMLTGQLPPSHQDSGRPDTAVEQSVLEGLKQVKPSLPAHVTLAIQRALAKDKAQRFVRIKDFIEALDSTALIRQRPTREISREDLEEALSKELPRDLDEHSEPDHLAEAVPFPMELEETTRKYPTLSMPALLLASAVREPHRKPLPVSVEAWPVHAAPFRHGWLIGGIALSLIAGAFAISLRHLFPARAVPARAPAELPALPEASAEPMLRRDDPLAGLPQASLSNLGGRALSGPSPGAILPFSQPALAKVKRRRKEPEYGEPIKHTPEVETALVNAQTEYVNGNYRVAVATARSVQSQAPVRSWRIIGAAACFMKSGSLIRDASRHLHSDELAQRLVSYVCKLNGLDLSGSPLNR